MAIISASIFFLSEVANASDLFKPEFPQSVCSAYSSRMKGAGYPITIANLNLAIATRNHVVTGETSKGELIALITADKGMPASSNQVQPTVIKWNRLEQIPVGVCLSINYVFLGIPIAACFRDSNWKFLIPFRVGHPACAWPERLAIQLTSFFTVTAKKLTKSLDSGWHGR